MTLCSAWRAARSAVRLRESDCWKQHSIGHSRVLNVAFPDERNGLSGKSDYIVPQAMFLPSLKIPIPEREQWNGGVLQEQRGITIFTDGSKLGGDTAAAVFCKELGLELYFRLNDDCRAFQAEIFAILRAIEAWWLHFGFGISNDLR